MAKSKKKSRPKKKYKGYPPLSKTDKFLYSALEVIGMLLILIPLIAYEALAGLFIFRNPEVLSFQERFTMFLLIPFVILYIPCIANAHNSKIPLFGNKKINYYSTVNHNFVLPLFDKRYKNMESRNKFLKKFSIWCCILILTFCLGILGFLGRHEFSPEGITTYSIFNNIIEEHSYDEVESYEVSAIDSYRYTRRGGYYESDIYLTVYLKNGDNYTASYTAARDVYALEEIADLLVNKKKAVDSRDLQAFIDRHNFSDNELKVIYRLFDM